MRLTKNQKRMLRGILQTNKQPGCGSGRPIHHGNAVSWDALIRKGLLTEARNEVWSGMIMGTLTKEGEAIAETLPEHEAFSGR